MKAIPFICSRTKEVDFLPDYLVRPADFEWKNAKKFVGNAMYDLISLDDIRYAVFPVGEYCVFGIACISKYLVKKIGYQIEEEYLRDKGKRSLSCFVGYAVKIADSCDMIPKNIVSDEFLKNCCDMYFEYLKPVWSEKVVDSKKVNDYIEIDDMKFNVQADITIKTFDGKNTIISNSENIQETLNFYLDSILNKKKDDSFITQVLYEDQWETLNFKNAGITKGLLSIIESRYKLKVNKKIQECEEEIKTIISDAEKYYNKLSENNNIIKNFLEIDAQSLISSEKVKEIIIKKPSIREDMFNKTFDISGAVEKLNNIDSEYLSDGNKNNKDYYLGKLSKLKYDINKLEKAIKEKQEQILQKEKDLQELLSKKKKEEFTREAEGIKLKLNEEIEASNNSEELKKVYSNFVQNDLKMLYQKYGNSFKTYIDVLKDKIKANYTKKHKEIESKSNPIPYEFYKNFFDIYFPEMIKNLEQVNVLQKQLKGLFCKQYELSDKEEDFYRFFEKMISKDIDNFEIKKVSYQLKKYQDKIIVIVKEPKNA